MSLVEFFSLDAEQDAQTQVVYRAAELTDICSGAITMKLVGKAPEPGGFLDETYPAVQTPATRCMPTKVKRQGMLVSGQLELTVGRRCLSSSR